ncbi:uncharacterized protein LOC133660199 isoform X2 [Entelurus aequoreus]|uniref:uncharacterized protein LOC133660199 isoform X2 n=1 Tax=Entelurus aequoreus TaxID=161455 RepID=UPI002B1DAFEF|nr:uncharacterized protein LOC133660199 isoform X2 [Entelurus aequoreus]
MRSKTSCLLSSKGNFWRHSKWMTWYIKSLQAEVCLCSPVHCLAPLHLHCLAFRPCQALHQLQHLLRSMSVTAADVERTLTLPTSPRLILLDGELTLRIIQLLMAYFDERRDALILLADMSATAADVERTPTLPTSPRLILLVAGDKVTIKRWMISMEGDVICEGVQPGFISGLAALLATYYVFNLEYQEEGARTLEFVQRNRSTSLTLGYREGDSLALTLRGEQRLARERWCPRRLGSWSRKRQQL